MTFQSLYRRYRPRRFAEVRGQDHVVTALLNALRTDTVGHAYLFSGPRGTGKTSSARLLAKALNCLAPEDGEPCGACESCTSIDAGTSYDLYELDAASNNGVDAMRDLISRTALGSPGRTKVYILDEVHMLSPAASNALLKTLEEPPEHVRFVLATTDPQKVLPTIRSRTQHFAFELLSAAELTDYVRWVCADAGLDIPEDAIAHVVREGRGSARDTLSALDQVVAAGGRIHTVAGVDPIIEALCERDVAQAMSAVAGAINTGADPRTLTERLVGVLRDILLAGLGTGADQVSELEREQDAEWSQRLPLHTCTRALELLGEALVSMRGAPDPRVPLEVALIRLTSSATETTLVDLERRVARMEKSRSEVGPPGGRPLPSAAPRPASATPAAPGPPDRVPSPRPGDGPDRPAPAQRSRAESAPPAPRPPGRTPPPPPPRAPTSAPGSRPGRPTSPTPGAAIPRPEPSHPEPPTAPTAPTAPTPGTATGGPGRDDLAAAFSSAVLPQLKGMAKALYSAGRFVSTEGNVAVFALDNAPTLSRAERLRETVEAALGAHFGQPVTLRLVTEAEIRGDGTSAAGSSASPAPPTNDARTSDRSPPGSAGPAGGSAPSGEGTRSTAAASGLRQAAADPEDEENIDLSTLTDAGAPLSDAERLLARFPGAEIVTDPPT